MKMSLSILVGSLLLGAGSAAAADKLDQKVIADASGVAARDFFLVFNHGVETSVDDPSARLASISNAVVAKLRWDFRL